MTAGPAQLHNWHAVCTVPVFSPFFHLFPVYIDWRAAQKKATERCGGGGGEIVSKGERERGSVSESERERERGRTTERVGEGERVCVRETDGDGQRKTERI